MIDRTCNLMGDAESAYPYPEVLLDEDGYPTEPALNYIKNWSFDFIHGEFITGAYFHDETLLENLITYLQAIWYYSDAVVYEDGLLELYTGGWSGNEEVISVLKHTTLWTMKHKISQAGGHYYFRIDGDSEKDWEVIKVDAKW
jgi:hypothetical protein